MKNLLLVFTLLFSLNCFSQGVLIIDSVNHNPTWAGDSLTMYIRTMGAGWGVDTGSVYMDVAGNTILSRTIASFGMGNQEWTILFPQLSTSYAFLNFTDGASYMYDAFYIQIDNTLDISSVELHKSIVSKRYFSMNGAEILRPLGVVIEETKFRDGSIVRKKVFIE